METNPNETRLYALSHKYTVDSETVNQLGTIRETINEEVLPISAEPPPVIPHDDWVELQKLQDLMSPEVKGWTIQGINDFLAKQEPTICRLLNDRVELKANIAQIDAALQLIEKLKNKKALYEAALADRWKWSSLRVGEGACLSTRSKLDEIENRHNNQSKPTYPNKADVWTQNL